jgi:glyoxylate carboligase
MPRMMAIEAAVHVLEKEGVTVCFGVPGAAINPLYSAMNRHGGIRHILARHVEGATGGPLPQALAGHQAFTRSDQEPKQAALVS